MLKNEQIDWGIVEWNPPINCDVTNLLTLFWAALDHRLVEPSRHRCEGDVVADKLAPLHHHHCHDRGVGAGLQLKKIYVRNTKKLDSFINTKIFKGLPFKWRQSFSGPGRGGQEAWWRGELRRQKTVQNTSLDKLS